MRVAFDYHVDVDEHYYSVPHALVGYEVWARYSAATVEVLHRGQRVASHVRSYQKGKHTTEGENMPKSHRAHLKAAQACLEDVDYKAARGLDKRQIAALAACDWVRRSQNVLITGPTGSGTVSYTHLTLPTKRIV